MGDRSACTMVFGGKINRATLRRLCEAYGASDEYGSGSDEPWSERHDDGQPYLCEPEVNGGYIEGFEAALVAAGIMFDRDSDACQGSYSASTASFRPGITDGFQNWQGDQGIYEAETIDDAGEAMLRVSEIRKHLAAGDLVAWLNQKHPDIPPLPPVEWDETPEPPCFCGESRADCDGECPEAKVAAIEARL